MRLSQIPKRSPLRDIDQPITPLISSKSRIKGNRKSDVRVRHVASGVIRALITLKPESRGVEDRVIGMIETGAFIVVDGCAVGGVEDPIFGDGSVWAGG